MKGQVQWGDVATAAGSAAVFLAFLYTWRSAYNERKAHAKEVSKLRDSALRMLRVEMIKIEGTWNYQWGQLFVPIPEEVFRAATPYLVGLSPDAVTALFQVEQKVGQFNAGAKVYNEQQVSIYATHGGPYENDLTGLLDEVREAAKTAGEWLEKELAKTKTGSQIELQATT
jgi:hypothetical protein